MKSYAKMFDEINQITQQSNIVPIQIVKSFQKVPIVIQYQPHFVNIHGEVNIKESTLSADIDNHLNMSFNVKKLKSFKINSIKKQKQNQKSKQKQVPESQQFIINNDVEFEVRNQQKSPEDIKEYLNQLQNKKVFNPVTNCRYTAQFVMDNVNITQLINQQGNIYALTTNMRFNVKHSQLLLGSEYVNIMSQKIQMAAVGLGVKSQNCQLIGQFNTEKTCALGMKINKSNNQFGTKLQINYDELKLQTIKEIYEKEGFKQTLKGFCKFLKYNVAVGFKKSFSRGELIINTSNDKIVSTVIRLALSQENLLELKCNQSIETGDVSVGFSFII